MNKSIQLLMISFLLIFFLTGCVSYQHREKYYDAPFEKLDLSGDGTADMDEFIETFPQGKEAVFLDADADRDGKIYPDEWFEFREKHGYKNP